MKLLHLEDDDSDAELFKWVILKEWPDCQITRLASRQEFETALRKEHFDLILSDYSMPGFDGLAALEMAHASVPETPFMFLSGTIGEDRAVQALKHGATDYILKHAPARLISAVKTALELSRGEAAKRHAEESLRQSREQFQLIAERIGDFIVLLDSQGHCLYANPTFHRMTGRTETSLGLNILEDIHPDDRGRFRQLLHKSFADGHVDDIEYRLLLPGNRTVHLEAQLSPAGHSNPESPLLLLAGRDVTERKNAEEMLREQASLLRKAHDAVCVFDLAFRVTQWNASAERIFRRTIAQALGADFRSILSNGDPSQFDAGFALTMATGEWEGEFRLKNPDGSEVILESSWTLVENDQGTAKSILTINNDVTRRRSLEEQLQKAQRIESLGLLASGIAHDLNNILSPITLSIGLLRPLATDASTGVLIDKLEERADHGAELVKQMLLFARGSDGKRTEIRLPKFLSQLKGLLTSALRTGVDLKIEPAHDVSPILADATQLKQIMMNLCINARDAMPMGGAIHISTRDVAKPSQEERGWHGPIPNGPCVCLRVSDTGTGIPDTIIHKIFDPLFTTKEEGKGTGLGLATIVQVVQRHEGGIRVESHPGEGTTFEIYLPAIVRPSAAKARVQHELLAAAF